MIFIILPIHKLQLHLWLIPKLVTIILTFLRLAVGVPLSMTHFVFTQNEVTLKIVSLVARIGWLTRLDSFTKGVLAVLALHATTSRREHKSKTTTLWRGLYYSHGTDCFICFPPCRALLHILLFHVFLFKHTQEKPRVRFSAGCDIFTSHAAAESNSAFVCWGYDVCHSS